MQRAVLLFLESRDPSVLCSLMTENYRVESAESGAVGDPVESCEAAVAQGLDNRPSAGDVQVEISSVSVDGEVAEVAASPPVTDERIIYETDLGNLEQVANHTLFIGLRKVEGTWLIDSLLSD